MELKNIETSISILNNVRKTHKGLERLVLFNVLTDMSNRCGLIIGCSGTGKSRASDLVYSHIERTKLKIDAVTISGIRKFQKLLSNNSVSIVVDDLSKGQTTYSQIATISVFSGLCYTGEVSKYTAQLDLTINNFKGSTIINLQPILLKKLATIPEFDSDIRDKAIRYYHLYFPTNPTLSSPNLNNIKIKYINDFFKPLQSKHFDNALENFRYAFSKARAEEHLQAYLTASAILNGRTQITESDEWMIDKLTRIFRIEPIIFRKQHLEGARQLNPNLLPLLSSIITYKKPSVKELVFRFGLSKQRVYEIINDLNEFASMVQGKGIIIPTKLTLNLIKEIGAWDSW